MTTVFGTDGIRGKVGVYPLTEDMIYHIGRAAAMFAIEKNAHKRKRQRISVAKDTRASADMFETQLVKGILSCGVDVVKFGVMTTPCAAFVAKKLNHDMAVIISASHNGVEDNGIKFFSSKGYKLTLEEEARMDSLIKTLSLSKPEQDKNTLAPENTAGAADYKQGEIKEEYGAISAYADLLKGIIADNDISGYKIAVDCAFGAVSNIIPEIAQRLGLDMYCINNTPDGMNINDRSGSLHPEAVSRYVLDNGLDCGFALDGDGDRVILCDEKGQIIDGDFILAIISKYLYQKGLLNKNSIATTHMSNLGLEIAVSQWGGRVIKTEVGDKYVLDKMSKAKLNLGGEQSGHIVLLDHSTTGDGLLAGLFTLKIMAQEKKPLSQLASHMYKFPQILLNVDVAGKIPIDELSDTKKVIQKAEKKLGSKGRLYIRYSGTENKLRIMVEGQDSLEIKEVANDIAAAAKEELDAKVRR
ncbi:MAG: phosphoglucosamine mutase [Candidatus Omnitrophica bacterium]|nr:phosphoglucosamine mutase [Candidatus Omnitrophota bacterium]